VLGVVEGQVQAQVLAPMVVVLAQRQQLVLLPEQLVQVQT